MKAFLRNLLIGGIFALVATQAQAAPPPGAVIWTFSGLPFTQIYDSGNNFVTSTTGGIQASGTITFDAGGNLLDFNFTTDGTPTSFGFNYTLESAQAFAPNDVNNPLFGVWTFAGLDDGAQHILALSLTTDINVDWGSGAIPSVSIVPGSTGESYGKDQSEMDGDYRIPGDTRDINLVANAVRVPEPASMALLGVGLLGLGFASRRRNRNSA